VAHSPDSVNQYGSTGKDVPDSEEERTALEERLRWSHEEKQAALADPGPTWREWFLYKGAKWYIGIGLFVVDIWEVGAFLPYDSIRVLEALGLIGPTIYAEFLLYRYLWYRPSVDETTVSVHRGGFRRSWYRPVRFGRWTPETAAIRAGTYRPPTAEGPDPREFL